MRIIVVVGARPNFIKIAPLVPALASAGIDARIAHTGQHCDAAMSDVFFTDLEIPEPAWFLGVGSGTHAVQTVHPRTRPLLEAAGITGAGLARVRLSDPVGYLDMLALQRDAAAIVTDSGGIQEEACMVGTPCVTVRRNTERAVTIAVGANRLAAADANEIGRGLDEALAGGREWERPERWDAGVSARVTEALLGGVMPLVGCG